MGYSIISRRNYSYVENRHTNDLYHRVYTCFKTHSEVDQDNKMFIWKIIKHKIEEEEI